MIHRRIAAAALASSLLLAPLPARAEAPPAAAEATAGDHFERGVRLYGEGDFGAALVEFERAYDIAPNWQVLFNIGQSYFQLRDYANALTTLQHYVAEGQGGIPAENRQIVDRELADLQGRVAHVKIRSNLDGATVSVDDRVVGKTPLAEPLLVSAGTRKITATHEGRAPLTTTVAVAGGDTSSVELTFPEAAAPSAPVAPAAPPRPGPSPTYAPGVVALGVGAAGLAVGSIFGAMALGTRSDLDKVCANKACPSTSQSSIDSLSRDATASTVGFLVGGVGIAAAIYLLVQPPTTEASTPPTTARRGLEVRPWVGLGSAGMNGVF